MDIKNIDKITENIVFDIIFEQIAASKLALEQDNEEELTPEEEADAKKVADELRGTKYPEELADEAEEAIKLAYASNVLNKDQADQVVQNFAKNPYKAAKKLMNTLQDSSFIDLYRKQKSRTKATDNYLGMLGKHAKEMTDKIGTDLKTAKVFKGPKNLSSQIKQAFPDLPPEALKGMLDDIAAQIKANDMLVKEATLEGLLEALLERRQQKSQEQLKREKGIEDMKRAAREKRPIIRRLKDNTWTGQRADGEQKDFHKREYNNNIATAKDAARAWARSEADDPETQALWKEFRDMLKRLDLHKPEGRDGAKEDDQAFVGAYRYYAAMKMVRNALRRGKELPVNNIKKWLTPLNENERAQGDWDKSDLEPKSGENFEDWIKRAMETFERQSLGGREAQRRYAKVKGSKVVSDQDITNPRKKKDGSMETPEEVVKRIEDLIKRREKDPDAARKMPKATRSDLAKARELAKGAAPIKVQKGVVNINQSVGSRLKAAGVDPRTMRGKAMTDKITQLIAKFLDGSLKRAGKNKDPKNPDVNIISRPVNESKMIRTIAENVFDELEECEIII